MGCCSTNPTAGNTSSLQTVHRSQNFLCFSSPSLLYPQPMQILSKQLPCFSYTLSSRTADMSIFPIQLWCWWLSRVGLRIWSFFWLAYGSIYPFSQKNVRPQRLLFNSSMDAYLDMHRFIKFTTHLLIFYNALWYI